MAITAKPASPVFEFGPFRLETANHLLLRDGEVIQLPPKAIDTLLVLIEYRGRVISKQELIERLWPDTAVESANLTQNIYLLRKALEERSHDQHYIETIPRRGYRFVAHVNAKAADEGPALADVGEAEPGSLGPGHVAHKRTTRAATVAVGLVIAALALISTYLLFSGRPASSAASVRVRSLAVLPFKPISREPRDEILELGLADTLITKLGEVHQVIVRPTSAVRKYGGLEQDPIAAGREQRVDLVLEGNIQRLGERIRVAVRLLDVGSGAALLSDTYDERLTDVFAAQDAISERVVQALKLRLTDDERARLNKRYTANAEAFQLYLKGRYFWERRTAESLQKAVAAFQQAIEKDPRYALAYVGLADAYIALPFDNDASPAEALNSAKAAATRALQLDDTLAEAHAALGFVNGTYEWNWLGAETELKRALELSPNSATAHQRYANHLVVMGRFPEALQEITRTLELEPVSLAANALAGRLYYFTRQYDRTLELCHKALDLDANFWIAHFFAGKADLQKGLYPQALVELRKAGDVTSEALATIGYVYAASGNAVEARSILDQLKRRRSQTYVPSSHVAKIHAALGEHDQAFVWLDTAYQQHDVWLMWLSSEPMWDSLRSDSRFTDLLRRLGLPLSAPQRMYSNVSGSAP